MSTEDPKFRTLRVAIHVGSTYATTLEFSEGSTRAYTVGSASFADVRVANASVAPIAFFLEREHHGIVLTPAYGDVPLQIDDRTVRGPRSLEARTTVCVGHLRWHLEFGDACGTTDAPDEVGGRTSRTEDELTVSFADRHPLRGRPDERHCIPNEPPAPTPDPGSHDATQVVPVPLAALHAAIDHPVNALGAPAALPDPPRRTAAQSSPSQDTVIDVASPMSPPKPASAALDPVPEPASDAERRAWSARSLLRFRELLADRRRVLLVAAPLIVVSATVVTSVALNRPNRALAATEQPTATHGPPAASTPPRASSSARPAEVPAPVPAEPAPSPPALTDAGALDPLVAEAVEHLAANRLDEALDAYTVLTARYPARPAYGAVARVLARRAHRGTEAR